ncbi:MAG: hypothetical protein RQ833_00945 [Sphingomonadaceae bacterium]|nr:hypothetical protein [Sphingomonadaceae bacterium]
MGSQAYAWWYVDALSDCGTQGLTIIGFVGSVFSPYYKRSGRADPADHAAMNVALYGPRGRWAMTERRRHALTRSADTLAIGPSAMRWTGSKLVIDLAERGAPLPWPVRGRVTVHPEIACPTAFALAPNGSHHWRPFAPRARVEAEFTAPALRWHGTGYFDMNWGREPLEAGFLDWQWSRAHVGREAAVIYEGVRADGARFGSALRFGADGSAQEEELPLIAPLPRTRWLLHRHTRADSGLVGVRRTWEDSPFYARSELATRLFGSQVTAVHESLDLRRFDSGIVQWMLPYRMPRAR